MKKFIKTANGYVDLDKIDSFTVSRYYAGEGEGYVVCAYYDETRWRLKEFETKDEAQSWLDKLISEINGVETNDNSNLS